MNRQKIGLVGWPGGGQNYGTSLQAYALLRKIAGYGYDVRYLRPPFDLRKALASRLRPFLIRFHIMKPKSPAHMGQDPEKLGKIRAFVRKNCPVSPRFWTVRGFRKHIEENYSCVVTGSDQIWNPYYLSPYNLLVDTYFPDSVKRISYSSSIGVEELPESVKPLYRRALECFSHLSLREYSGVRIVSGLLGRKDVRKVLDPVFLLGRAEWDEVIARDAAPAETPRRPYVLCYFVGDNAWYWDRVRRILSECGYEGEVIVLPLESTHYGCGFTLCETAGIGDFVRLVRDADLLLTDSFHATVLGIIYRKPFVEFLRFKTTDKAAQNSRLTELLERYGLQDRWYEAGREKEYMLPIDYGKVYGTLVQDIKESEDYLKKAISK